MLKATKIADVHTHISDHDIEKNLAMLKSVSDYGIKDINIACITYHEHHQIDENIRALYCKNKFKDASVSVFGGLYYDAHLNHFGVPYLEQAKRLLDMGCDGLKFIENKPNFRSHLGFGINSKIYDDMFDMLEEKGVPLLCHINDPEEYWDEEKIKKWPIGQRLIDLGWMYTDDMYLKYQEIIDETVERLERNPKLNIIFAHFMFISGDIEFAKELVTKYPNLKFDLTPGWEMFVGFRKNYDAWREFFETYSDRIFYGTDTSRFPVNKKIHETVRYCVGGEDKEIPIPHADFETMRGFDLSKEAQENICYNNFKKFIGTPKAVDTEMLAKEAEKMIKLLTDNDPENEAIARLKTIYDDLTR